MKKKSSSKSAFFNFRVLLWFCLAGAVLVLAAFGARPGGSASGPHQSATAVSGSQISVPDSSADKASTTDPRADLRASAVFATKLSGPRATEIFNLATASAAQAANSESPNSATLTTDREDYEPFSYVYITGTGFQPGEIVDMIVVELSPIQQSFVPWTAVADQNGNFQTSWYVFTEDLMGATMQVTGTGELSQLTASATFTDAPACGEAVNGDPGNFEIEGNVVAIASPHTDWVDTTPGTNGLVDPATGLPFNNLVTYRRHDPFNGVDDIFAQSNKTNDDPNTYNWKTNSAVNKDDLNNVYVHISIDSRGDRWLTASADRLNNGGTAFADFELNQGTVTKVTDTGCASSPCGHFTAVAADGSSPAATGGRTPNDILVTAQYGNGGSAGTMIIYQWKIPTGGSTYEWVDITSGIPPAVFAFICTNTVAGPGDHPPVHGVPVPYGAFGGTSYGQNQFVEMAIDSSHLIATIDPCLGIQIKTVFVKTKTSTATTASLDDLVDPIPVSFNAGFVVTGSQTPPLCHGGTGSVTATWTGGTGPFECSLDDPNNFGSCTGPGQSTSYSGLAGA